MGHVNTVALLPLGFLTRVHSMNLLELHGIDSANAHMTAHEGRRQAREAGTEAAFQKLPYMTGVESRPERRMTEN